MMASALHLPILSVLLSMFALLFNVFLWGAALERAFIHRFTISGGGVDGGGGSGGVYQDGPKSQGHGYKGSSPFTDDFNSFVADVMGEWKLPGMAIAVVDGEDVFTQVSARSEVRGSSTRREKSTRLTGMCMPKGVRLRKAAGHKGHPGDAVVRRLHDQGAAGRQSGSSH